MSKTIPIPVFIAVGLCSMLAPLSLMSIYNLYERTDKLEKNVVKLQMDLLTALENKETEIANPIADEQYIELKTKLASNKKSLVLLMLYSIQSGKKFKEIKGRLDKMENTTDWTNKK